MHLINKGEIIMEEIIPKQEIIMEETSKKNRN